MKRSASVKLLGRGSGVTSSCLAFELTIGRVTSASVVIVWWHFYVLALPGAWRDLLLSSCLAGVVV